VFALFPHPMYTVGYSFYYGLSLITRSYVVLYVSLFAHFCQLLFLVVVEDPRALSYSQWSLLLELNYSLDIEKTYGSMVKEQAHDKDSTTILYNKQTGYFRRDLIVFKNFFVFRSSDFFTVLIFFYNLVLFFSDFSSALYVAYEFSFHNCFLFF
jgi:phosphatidylethanolamine N-methyltransferase